MTNRAAELAVQVRVANEAAERADQLLTRAVDQLQNCFEWFDADMPECVPMCPPDFECVQCATARVLAEIRCERGARVPAGATV